MSIYKDWLALADREMSQDAYNKFWSDYFMQEQKNYEAILEAKNTELKGSVKELADGFQMDTVTFTGFLDGINTSLVEAIDLETLDEETQLDSTIIWDKLYYNMLNAKADWLYTIPTWDGILSEDERKQIKKDFNRERIVVKEAKIGRNDPCPCGSGKKYKKCCLNK